MLGRMGSRAAIAMALMIGVGSAGAIQPAPMVTVNAPRHAKRGLFGGYRSSNPMTYGSRGAGITMAQQQRASQKRKNVQRHRRHVRG